MSGLASLLLAIALSTKSHSTRRDKQEVVSLSDVCHHAFAQMVAADCWPSFSRSGFEHCIPGTTVKYCMNCLVIIYIDFLREAIVMKRV